MPVWTPDVDRAPLAPSPGPDGPLRAEHRGLTGRGPTAAGTTRSAPGLGPRRRRPAGDGPSRGRSSSPSSTWRRPGRPTGRRRRRRRGRRARPSCRPRRAGSSVSRGHRGRRRDGPRPGVGQHGQRPGHPEAPVLEMPPAGLEPPGSRPPACVGHPCGGGPAERTDRHRDGVVERAQPAADGRDGRRRLGQPAGIDRAAARHGSRSEPGPVAVRAGLQHPRHRRPGGQPPEPRDLGGQVRPSGGRRPLHVLRRRIPHRPGGPAHLVAPLQAERASPGQRRHPRGRVVVHLVVPHRRLLVPAGSRTVPRRPRRDRPSCREQAPGQSR